MLKVALRLRSDIEASRVLHRLFSSSSKSPVMSNEYRVPDEEAMLMQGKWFMAMHELDRFDVTNYRLVVIGHSLGGGIASILVGFMNVF